MLFNFSSYKLKLVLPIEKALIIVLQDEMLEMQMRKILI